MQAAAHFSINGRFILRHHGYNHCMLRIAFVNSIWPIELRLRGLIHDTNVFIISNDQTCNRSENMHLIRNILECRFISPTLDTRD